MATRLLRIGLMVSCVIATACYVRAGNRVETSRVANSPQGVSISLRLESTRFEFAELLEASDSGLLVLRKNEIASVAFREITSVSFEGSVFLLQRRSPPSAGLLRNLRLRSRFPQGVSAEMLASLLASTGQSSVKVLEQ